MNILQMSCAGAAMIIVISCARALAIDRLPKKAFLVLWGIVLLRLLVPFSLPSAFSVYSLMRQPAPAMKNMHPAPIVKMMPMITEGQKVTDLSMPARATAAPVVLIGAILWITGMTVCFVFFTVSYIRCQREFCTSFPVDNSFVKNWLSTLQIKRKISVRQSGRISTPLTYGVLRPVILLPKGIDWENTTMLEYVLTHEYVHIRRYDAALKIIMIAAVCIHWFNPFVWVMYILANRDIELSCDETVVRFLGECNKSSYALTLISMEEAKREFAPLYNNFSKNSVEERVTAIMKIKKTSLIGILTAAVLVLGVTAFFATSAAAKQGNMLAVPDTPFTEEEYKKLFALKFDGYEDMSVSEYQTKVWELTDTKEYMDLRERFAQDEKLYEMKDSNETASFLFNVLEPLTAERWQTRDFGGSTVVNDKTADAASLEYTFTMTILDRNSLTVKEYRDARLNVIHELQRFLEQKSPKELREETEMLSAIVGEKKRLEETYSSDSLKIEIGDYFYQPPENYPSNHTEPTNSNEKEPRTYPYGTQENYHTILALKTAEYQKMSVKDFNTALLECVNNIDYDQFQGVQEDISFNDYQVKLSEEELSFLELTFSLSNNENASMIRSDYTGKPEVNPWVGGGVQYVKQTDESDYAAWCSLWYQFSYHISDKNLLTIGERDRCIGGFLSEIQTFWDNKDIEELLLMTKEDVISFMKKKAAKNSTNLLTILIDENQVQFEHLDERDKS